MSFFDFLFGKKKQQSISDKQLKIAGEELRNIIGFNKIDSEESEQIFIDSLQILRKAKKKITFERLKQHTELYYSKYFTDDLVLAAFWHYLNCFHFPKLTIALLYELFPCGHIDRISGGKVLISLSDRAVNDIYSDIDQATEVFTKLHMMHFSNVIKLSGKEKTDIEPILKEFKWFYRVDIERLVNYLIHCSNAVTMEKLNNDGKSFSERIYRDDNNNFKSIDPLTGNL